MNDYIAAFMKEAQERPADPVALLRYITDQTQEFLANLKARDVVSGVTGATTGVTTGVGAHAALKPSVKGNILTEVTRRNPDILKRHLGPHSPTLARITSRAARGPAAIIGLLAGLGAGAGTHHALKPKPKTLKLRIPFTGRE